MIKNYLIIALRNLRKYKFISFINLFGLTIGLTCCLLILAYILNELSFDRYNKQADKIYRVTRTFRNPETKAISLQHGTVSPPFGPLLKNDFKQIEKMTVMLPNGNIGMRYGDKIFNETNSYFADEHLFDVFDVKVLKGNPDKALTDPFSVMLSEEIAKKYFGSEDPINKQVKLDNQFNCKISGVFKAFPANSHIHPELLIAFNTLRDSAIYGEENLRTNWGNNSFLTYIVLPDDATAKTIEAQLPAFIDRQMPAGYYGKYAKSAGTDLHLQKLTDIHLRSHLDYEAEENGDIKRVYIFAAIALFILLIACINYMNLSTARSALRAREIGIRKVVGAERKELITQFLTESVLIAFTSMILAIGLTFLLLPALNKVSGQELSMSIFRSPRFIASLILIPVAVGLLSGIYPAVFLSSFKPVSVLKGLFKAGGANISFRKVLVTVQFAISIILIISTGIVFLQMRYMQNKNLGYDRDHIVTMAYTSALADRYDAFRNDLLSNASIKDVARSSRIPTGRLLDNMGAAIDRGDSLTPINSDIKYLATDQDFIKTFNIKMVAGRAFSRDFGTDTSAYLINEAAVAALELKSNESAIGKNFRYGGRDGKLVGVFHDFHFESLHQKIVPMVMVLPVNANNYNRLSIKIAGNNIQGALSHIENVWKKFLPETPYQSTFLDENFNRLYTSEQRQGTLFTIFAAIAILIACLGLFGLSAFAITQRIKEIGIRKVLGANVGSIVQLLSKDFLKLVGLAALIAFPIAWYAMHNWLNDFAYRTNIPWWLFAVAGIMSAIIALFTISFQAIKAALANPVKSLRSE